MTVWDIINPWGALRRERAQNQHALDECREAEHRLANRVQKLQAVVAKGHFRNPATGRLGRRGEIF